MSNPLDVFVPPDFVLDDLEVEGETEEQRASRIFQIRQLRLLDTANRRARNRRMARRDSSSSGSDRAASSPQTPLTNGVAKLTVNDGEAKKEEKKEDKLVKLDPNEIGMSVGYKNLYSGKEDKRGRFQWQTEIPEDLGKPAEDAESEKWAIIVRHVKTYNDPKKVLTVHSIVIQSPLLKDLLKEVLAGYPGVTVGLKRLEFSGRFEPLIHRWPELLAAIERLKEARGDAGADEKTDERIKHAELLQELLAKDFKDSIDASSDLKSQGVMTYEHLWTLFQPGSMVYSKQQSQDRIFRLQSSQYGQDRNGNQVYWLSCQYVDYDGQRFGTNKLNVSIPIYEGTRPIINLPTLPLDFHGDKDALKRRLIERGGKIEVLAGSHYRAYNGVGWRMGSMGQKEKYSIKGRIVIDIYGWNRFNPNMAVYCTAFHVKDNSAAAGTGSGEPPPAFGEEEYDGGYDDEDGGMPIDGFFADEDEEEVKRTPLTDEQKMICVPLVRGYALKEKLWLNFFVNAVQDIEFSARAFDSLVLPSNQKELILGFTQTQQGYRSQFDDVIEGKGRGIIILLCGPPGVGKTLTAESVAEQMKVPLYMMSAGDLGLDPRHVEAKLQGILDMCTRWNAILLLDEADIFLESRSLHELERNKLVSIFLRVLEYYEGIMFLTTNRVQTFDAAFQSRIHISLDYKELDQSSRKTVWQNFLSQHDVAQAAAREKPLKALASAAKATKNIITEQADGVDEAAEKEAQNLHFKRTLPHNISQKDLIKLSQLSMNGRQIKNVLKTAQLLASKRGESLSYEHVRTVMEVTQHLHQSTQASKEAQEGIYN